jgi:hypothetical protein
VSTGVPVAPDRGVPRWPDMSEPWDPRRPERLNGEG